MEKSNIEVEVSVYFHLHNAEFRDKTTMEDLKIPFAKNFKQKLGNEFGEVVEKVVLNWLTDGFIECKKDDYFLTDRDQILRNHILDILSNHLHQPEYDVDENWYLDEFVLNSDVMHIIVEEFKDDLVEHHDEDKFNSLI